MSANDLEDDAARADLCRYLAACYYQPGPEFAEERVFESIAAAAAGVDPELATHAHRMADDFTATGHERLLLDYARLFLNPNGALASPYESSWREPGQNVRADGTPRIVALYREGGFEIGEDFHDLPDHVACELEFLYLLRIRELQARATGDREAEASAVMLRRRLFDEHLGAWIFGFTAAVAAGAQSAFYRELAALTEGLARLEDADSLP